MPNCVHCGQHFYGEQDTCPNCGHPFTPEEKRRMTAAMQTKNTAAGTTNGLSIARFVISLVSLFFSGYGLVGLVGWILSGCGRSNAINAGGKTGLATAGIVLGIIGSVGTWLLMLILPKELRFLGLL
ncbi:MAG: hypothetical protein SOX25_08240 [Eubacteriales bacterium]|nr:hypothetical protein [Eubacteriales bacterium]